MKKILCGGVLVSKRTDSVLQIGNVFQTASAFVLHTVGSGEEFIDRKPSGGHDAPDGFDHPFDGTGFRIRLVEVEQRFAQDADLLMRETARVHGEREGHRTSARRKVGARPSAYFPE